MCPPAAASPVVSPACAPAGANPVVAAKAAPTTKPPARRSGKALWAAAKVKVHAYHGVVHELEHRAKEKAFFGLCEHVLGRTVRFVLTADRLSEHGAEVIVESGRKLRGALRKAGGWLKRAAARAKATLGGRKAAAKAAAHGAHGAHGHAIGAAFGSRQWATHRALHALHVAIPLAGAYLVAHMAAHDFARARREWRHRRAALATALFFVGAACDALDALAHAAIVLGLTAFHVDHHTEHVLHEASMAAAIVACACMMVGEALSGDSHGHAHGGAGGGHGHGGGGGGESLKERMRAAGMLGGAVKTPASLAPVRLLAPPSKPAGDKKED